MGNYYILLILGETLNFFFLVLETAHSHYRGKTECPAVFVKVYCVLFWDFFGHQQLSEEITVPSRKGFSVQYCIIMFSFLLPLE